MGDLRASFRHLTPLLVAAGHRVACLDLRGHGDSDTTFTDYGAAAAGADVVALAEHLGGPAIVVGNSLGGGAAAWAAAERPDLVTRIVLVDPFLHDPRTSALTRLGTRLLLTRPWGPTAWDRYYAGLFKDNPPADLAEHRHRNLASLTRPDHWRAFVRTTRTSHRAVEERVGEVRAPALVVMGGRDPDFPDPAAEARTVADRLGAQVVMVPGAGHYPHAEYPDAVAKAILEFLDGAPHA